MQYGDEKIRDIARSVLPSTKRKQARRSAASLKRTNRRVTRQTLHAWAQEIDAYDFEGHIYDYGDAAAARHYGWSWWGGDIKSIMWERRDGDKLGALLKWAVAVTAHMDDPEDRYMFMKGVLPDNLIGRHALSHVENLEEFDFRDEWNRWRFHGTRSVPNPVRDPEHVAGLLRAIIANGNHRAFNRLWLLDTKDERIILAGLHDIDRVATLIAHRGGERARHWVQKLAE